MPGNRNPTYLAMKQRLVPAPLPVRLELPLGDVSLDACLATSLLHDVVKFILYARGQTTAPYDYLRENLKVNTFAI